MPSTATFCSSVSIFDGGQKAGQGKREDRKQRGENRKHDSLLADVLDCHPGFSYAFFCRRLACFDRQCKPSRQFAQRAVAHGGAPVRSRAELISRSGRSWLY